jgi:hypothetical protein
VRERALQGLSTTTLVLIPSDQGISAHPRDAKTLY